MYVNRGSTVHTFTSLNDYSCINFLTKNRDERKRVYYEFVVILSE